ncbi:hypothetical protein ScPMuIL_004041 [Solemya velum]
MAGISFETGVIPPFHIADYILFGITLALSAVIGLYYVIRDRKNHSTEQYLLGGRQMMVGPVALSMLSSFISAITILGVPAEVYKFDTMYWWVTVGFVIAAFGAGHIFIPIFYNLSLTSSFEYLELRFGRVARVASSLQYMLWMLVYMSITLYGPALSLSVVTGLSLWGSIIAVGVVCTFYTTLGGMKAVLWTDTLQMCIMFIGMISLLLKTSMELGGFEKAWAIADERKRIKLIDFNTDPRTRMTIWSTVIGGAVFWCTVYGTNQAQIQRALSLPSMKRAKIAIWMNVVGFFSIISLSIMVGVVMFAFYSDCDPLTFGLVTKVDQLVALLSMDVLADTPGLAGIILTTVFSGSLSTMSSGLSAMSAVILEDYIKPMFWPNIRQYQAKMCSMVIVVAGGAMCLGMAFIVSQFGDILQAAYALFGILGGPLLGIFSLGILFPWANQIGAVAGQGLALGILMWIGLGTKIAKVTNAVVSPLSTEGCNYSAFQNSSNTVITSITTTLTANISHLSNFTDWGTTTPSSEGMTFDPSAWYVEFYKVSHMWYTPMAVVITVVFGLIVSLLTGYTKPSTLDARLICPLFDILFPYLPESILTPLRFGVKHTPSHTSSTRDPGLRLSLCLNDASSRDGRSNGGPTPDGSELRSSAGTNKGPDGDIELETSMNAEIDVLTRDSMSLGLVANTGTLMLDLGTLTENEAEELPQKDNLAFTK